MLYQEAYSIAKPLNVSPPTKRSSASGFVVPAPPAIVEKSAGPVNVVAAPVKVAAAPIKPAFDFIDRTKLVKEEPAEEKLIFFDEVPTQQPGVLATGLPYEESTDAAQLYNPLTGTVKSAALTGTRVFPAFMGTTGKYGGRQAP